MRPRKRFKYTCRALLILTAVLGIFIESCSDKGQDGIQPVAGSLDVAGPAANGADPFQLPFPDDIPSAPQRQGSITDADLVRNALEFDAALPNNLVTASNLSLNFDADSTQQGLAGAAFCVYSFQLAGFDRNPTVVSEWNNVEDNQVYIGLADWPRERWKWFARSTIPDTSLGSMDPFIREDGLLLVAIVYLGEDPALLNRVRIGGLLPQAEIRLTPNGGFIPVDITPDASLSRDVDGSIIKYEWDLDNDGVFEVQSTEPDLPSISFDAIAQMPIALRVTDNDLLKDVDEKVIVVDDGWAHTLGGPNSEQFLNLIYDGSGALYAIGNTRSFGAGFDDAWLAKFDQAGNLLWSRTWGTAEEESGVDLAIDSAGSVIMLASGGTTSTEVFLLKWSSSGDLLASKRILDPNGFFPSALTLLDDRAIVVGKRFDAEAQFGARQFLFSYDFATDFFWIRQWELGSGFFNDFRDVEASPGIFPGFERYYCVGTAQDRAALVECDDEGHDIIAQKLNTTDLSGAHDLNVSGVLGLDKQVCGFARIDTVDMAFVAKWDLEEQSSFTWAVDGTQSFTTGYARSSSGAHITCGTGAQNSSWIHGFKASGETIDQTLLKDEFGRIFLNGLTLVNDTTAAVCGLANTSSSLPLGRGEIQFNPGPLSWETISITDALLDPPQIGDFVGMVTSPEVVLDQEIVDGDFGDALIMVKSVPVE